MLDCCSWTGFWPSLLTPEYQVGVFLTIAKANLRIFLGAKAGQAAFADFKGPSTASLFKRTCQKFSGFPCRMITPTSTEATMLHAKCWVGTHDLRLYFSKILGGDSASATAPPT